LIVIDASVAVKWCLADEELVPQAEQLLARYRRSEIRLAVPDLFWVELANALWKAVRKQRVGIVQARRSFFLILDLKIPTIATAAFVPAAMELAVRHDRTVYDAIYVELASQLRTDMITADERLANALAARLPVKWLGAWNL
jgi:predicted nucleic acid-binding protein